MSILVTHGRGSLSF